MDMLLPPMSPPPERLDAREVFDELLQRLEAACLGQTPSLRRLALVGTAHLLAPDGTPGAIRWIIGPSGAGKSTVLRALAEALDLPAITLSVPRLTASGWAGTEIEEVCSTALAREVLGGRRWRRPLLILDDAQHVRIKSEIDGPDRSHQINRQSSLLDIVGGTGTIPLRGHPPVLWSTCETLRIISGAFELTPADEMSPEALERYGFIPELANRLAQPAIHMTPLVASDVARMLIAYNGGPTREVFRRLGGGRLSIEPSAATLLANRVSRRPGATPRTAMLALEAVMEAKVLDALAGGALDRNRAPLRIAITRADLAGVA